MKRFTYLAVVCGAIASFACTALADPIARGGRVAGSNAVGGTGLRAGGAFNGTNVDAAGGRRVVTDGNGNVAAGGNAGFTTANGSSGSRSTRFTRSADGTASGERSTSLTNANTGVTMDASSTYTKGSGVSRSASCTDASGHTVTCGAAR